jgi:hypothetical protein
MALIAKKSSGDFVLCPAGAHLAVCADVIDLGLVKTQWQGKEKTQHKVRIVWQINERNTDGKPFVAQRRYTLSLDDRAALRKDLESWRGRAFSEDELNGFDVESVIGKGCMLNVVHEARDGKTYDNVATVMRLPRGMGAPSIENYVRVKDRPTEGGANAPADSGYPDEPGGMDDDANVPF